MLRSKEVEMKKKFISRSAFGPGSPFARSDCHKRLESSHVSRGMSILLLLLLLLLVVMLVFVVGRRRVETSRGVVACLKGVGMMRRWWWMLRLLLLIDRVDFVMMVRGALCRRSRLRIVIGLEAGVSPDRLGGFVRRVRYLVLLLLLQLLMLMLSMLLWQNASWRIGFLQAVGVDNDRVILGAL